jgi:Peptidase family M20/M25/M40
VFSRLRFACGRCLIADAAAVFALYVCACARLARVEASLTLSSPRAASLSPLYLTPRLYFHVVQCNLNLCLISIFRRARSTISFEDGMRDGAEHFLALHALLEEEFPKVHQHLEWETVANYSLLYRWEGSDRSLRPYLLASHLDVVPTPDETLADWEVDPFSGVLRDGFVYGRGSMDDKCGVVALLAACEDLIAQGFRPQRTLYLGFGHDEEIGGQGAQAIVRLLQSREVRLEFVLDEGLPIMLEGIPGVSAPTALIGVSEKGFVSVELEFVAGRRKKEEEEKGGGRRRKEEEVLSELPSSQLCVCGVYTSTYCCCCLLLVQLTPFRRALC